MKPVLENKYRYSSLDSLRGIACIQVVLGHCAVSLPSLMWIVYPDKNSIPHDFVTYLVYSPLHFLFSATPAVKVFFVLSGFVLSLPYFQNTPYPNYIKFAIKRIIRLYLPCLSIIIISVVLKKLVYEPGQLSMFSNWINDIWKNKETLSEWKNRLLLNNEITNVNPALWTLPIEIKLSLILPLFILLVKRLNNTNTFFVVFIFTVLYHIGTKTFLKEFTEYHNLFYFTYFLWGMLLCKHREQLTAWINNIPQYLFGFFLIGSFLIFTSGFTLQWLSNNFLLLIYRFEDYISAMASVMFIILSLSHRANRLLNGKVFIYLGKISFSLYLVHPVVIVTLAYFLRKVIDKNYIILLAFIFSILFHYCIMRL